LKQKEQTPEKDYIQAIFRGNKLAFLLTVLMAGVLGTFTAIASLLLGAVTDCMTAGDWDGMVRIAWLTALGIPVMGLHVWIGLRIQARYVRKGMQQYKNLAFERLSRKSISAFTQENTGRYLSALTNDANSVETQFLKYMPALAEHVVSFVLSLGVMLWYSPLLTLVLVVASAVPILTSLLLSGRYAAWERQVSDENEGFTGRIKDLLSGFAVTKSFKAEREVQRIFEGDNAQLEQKKEGKNSFEALVNALSTASGILAQMATFIVGGFMAIRGIITPGTVMIFVNLCNGVLGPIQNIPVYFSGVRAAKGLIRKLAELTQENTTRDGERIEPVLHDGITFQNVSFGYEPDQTVLKGISLKLEPGKKYAIVGASGSGKSTLLNLLMGGYTGYEGSIAIDGREITSIDPDSLYEIISLIGQNVFLFDATVRENITMFRDFPDHAVDSAAERAGLLPVMEAKGEDYRCGENGAGLSGGERQRVSIARSLLRGNPVLMLDEATAALDNQTAWEVTDAILRLDGLTRIVVTHRLAESLLRRYDANIALRDGRVTEQGTFEELMDRKRYFYSLYHVGI